VARAVIPTEALSRVLQTAPVRDAILIGSAVLAPDTARDLDIVVTAAELSEGQREMLQAALEDAAGRPVDLIVRQPGDVLGSLALAIAAGDVLKGRGESRREAVASLERAGGLVSSFDEAEASLRAAERILAWAAGEVAAQDRLEWYKTAFDKLFHAARVAALCYRGGDSTRWGGLQKQLPPPFGQRFQTFVETLHIRYAYDGRIPDGREEDEFTVWKAAVREFIDEMRARVVEREGGSGGAERGR
jgi:predicted nucleotidyltransferase